MTTAAEALKPHVESVPDDALADLPDADFVVAPASVADAASILEIASRGDLRVLIWGGGTHQGYGHAVDCDIVLLTTRMNRIVEWIHEDLTLVVEAGARVADVATMLDERSQTAVLIEHPGAATIGGVVASGVSPWSRLRYGPVRDRMLQVVLATGDGRVVTGGGRVVKNVTGYDLPRIATGSFGAFGVIGTVCLKLWPRPRFEGTVAIDDPVAALEIAYRPLAVVETEEGAWVYLAGMEPEVFGQARLLEGSVVEGLAWPDPLDDADVVVVRVPPRLMATATDRVRSLGGGVRFRAAYGVGEIRIGCSGMDAGAAIELRRWAESVGGALVVARRSGAGAMDAWGTPPGSVDLQRRVKAAFDPRGIVNPGRLPGGI